MWRGDRVARDEKRSTKHKQARNDVVDLDSMDITDDFMFGTVFQDLGLCKGLVELLLGIEVSEIEFAQRQDRLDAGPLSRAGVVDLMVRDRDGNLIDVEMQNRVESDIALRARRYLSLMDLTMLNPSQPFGDVGGAIVVFICTFDPFDRGWKRYNFPRVCSQDGVPLGDKTDIVFITAMGTHGEYGPEFDAFLRYLRDHNDIEGDYVRSVDDAVKAWRSNPLWRRLRMLWSEKYRNDFAQATAEGRETGYAEGHKEGHEQGVESNRRATAKLARKLQAAGREGELISALQDSNKLDALMEEFGIKD